MNQYIQSLYKEKLLEILCNFDDLCNKYNINYFAASGTAIGALRHSGFIPWDDDIDVYMLRNDYNKLLSIMDSAKDANYSIYKIGDPGYVYSFSKFCDNRTTLIEYRNMNNCCIGVYIDIFPLDYIFDINDLQDKKVQFKKLYSDYQATFFTPNFKDFLNRLYYKKNREILIWVSPLKKKEIIRDNFKSYVNYCTYGKGEYLTNIASSLSSERCLFKKDWFDDYVYVPFEDTKIRLCKKFHEYLTTQWGDYMTPPPIDKQVSNHYHYYLNLKEGLSLLEAKDRMSKGEYLVY